MATFESAFNSLSGRKPADKDTAAKKYPIKFVEPSIDRFIKVLKIDLERLQAHKKNVEKFQRLGDFKAQQHELINASRTVKQVKRTMVELERTRNQVCEQDLEKFDKKVNDIKEESSACVAEYLDFYSSIQPEDGEELQDNSRSDGEQVNNFEGPITTKKESCYLPQQHSLPSYQPLQSEFDLPPCVDDNLLMQQATLLREQSEQEAYERENAHSWNSLREGLQDLNGIIHNFSSMVHSQQEAVDRIEDNIEHAQAEVEGAAVELGKAAKLKAAAIPLVAAAAGGALLGPIGLVAVGVKVGVAAAVGGGIFGFTGGSIWKNKQNKIVDADLANLSSKTRSVSLPDVRNEETQDLLPTKKEMQDINTPEKS